MLIVPPSSQLGNRHDIFTVADYPNSLHVLLIKSKFHSDSFFLRTVTLWNNLPRECFLDNYNLGLKLVQSQLIYLLLVLIILSYFPLPYNNLAL